MAPLLYLLSIGLLFHLQLPAAVAGPACAKKHFEAAGCIQLCKSRWGWSGTMMGSDPWGAVMQKSDQSADAILASACGTKVTSATESAITSATQIPSSSSTPLSSVLSTISPSATQITSSASEPEPTSFLASSSSSSSAAIVTTSTKEPESSAAFDPVANVFTTKSTKTNNEATQTSVSTSTRAPVAQAPTTTTSVKTTPVATTAAQTATSESGTSASSSSSSDINAYLSAHNSVRANHGASPLTWSDSLASKAQEWANKCQFVHSGGSLGPFGENLAAGTGDSYTIASAVGSWTEEVSQYNPTNPEASHFTQVVWKGTSQVGCAVQLCDGIFAASFGKAKFHVCEYSAQGNIIGEFAQNVQA